MTKYTAFRCPEDLLAKARIKAEADRRSLSNYLITLIEKDVADVPDEAIARPAARKRPAKKSARPAKKKAKPAPRRRR